MCSYQITKLASPHEIFGTLTLEKKSSRPLPTWSYQITKLLCISYNFLYGASEQKLRKGGPLQMWNYQLTK